MNLTIFSIKKDLEAKLAAKTLEVDTQAKEIETLKEVIKGLEAKTNTGFTSDQFNALSKERDELSSHVESLVKQLEETDGKMKDFEARASAKALEIVQSTGAPAVNVAETPIVVETENKNPYRFPTHYNK